MSVNDDLPWIPPTLELIRKAAHAGIPVIGHCLGGQLMAKALGGTVGSNPVKEIGWGEVERDRCGAGLAGRHRRASRLSTGTARPSRIPPGATRILQSAHCANQAFVRGPHLGMQCHVEMTETMIRSWCQQWAAEECRPRPRCRRRSRCTTAWRRASPRCAPWRTGSTAAGSGDCAGTESRAGGRPFGVASPRPLVSIDNTIANASTISSA